MKNKIFEIKKDELIKLKKQLQMKNGIWIAEIDGNKINSWVEYAHEIYKAFRFPTPCYKSIDAYSDWIRDLEWLESDGYVLIIHNFKNFMKRDLELKKLIIKIFNETVFPWWESEVEEFCVDGKAKPFNVYLVD